MVQASDRIACVAAVGAIVDRNQTIHSWGLDSAKQFMAFPNIVLAEGDAASVMLYRYRCDGEFCGDTWHPSLRDAQGQAEYEYGEALGPWMPVPPDVADAHEYAIRFARKSYDNEHCTTGGVSLDRSQSENNRVFYSTPRKHIILRFLISATLLAGWIWIMNVSDPNLYILRFLGLFLLVATSALLVLALRRPCMVVLDAENFTFQRGKKKIVIPWPVLGQEDSRLKWENLLGWQRLNIRTMVNGKKTYLILDNIFGVGLPVAEILRQMQQSIVSVLLFKALTLKKLTVFARVVAEAFLARFPQLASAIDEKGGDLEISLKCPETNYEVVLTSENEEVTIYFNPFPWHQHFDWPPEKTEENCFDILDSLINERLLITFHTKDDTWVGSSSMVPGEVSEKHSGLQLSIRSFRGTYDKDIQG